MLSTFTLEKLTDLTQVISAQGRVAMPVADSPLELLCNNSTITGIDSSDNIIQKISLESDNYVHNDVMDELIGNVSKAVCSHIDFAKNVVNPAIKDVVAHLAKTVDSYNTETVINMKIERVTMPDFLKNSGIKGDIEGYSSAGVRKYIEPDGVLKLPAVEMDQLPDAIMTGGGNVDTSIGTWLAGRSEGLLHEVWENFFGDPKDHRRSSVSMIAYLNDTSWGVDRAIAVFLMARKLSINPPKKNDVAFRSLVKQFLEVSSYRLSAFIKKIELAEKSNQIILSIDQVKNVIKVCSSTYLPWLDQGNTPEVIYGAAVLGGNNYTADKLAQKKTELLKAWTVHRSAVNSSHRNSYYANYIKALRDGFYNSMKTMLESEREYHQSNSHAMGTISNLLETELREVSVDDRKDHYRTVTRLVTKARFFYTDSFRFLSTVDSLTKNNDHTLEEALNVATIEYVADYVSGQILIR